MNRNTALDATKCNIAAESSECQSHSLTNIIPNNLLSLEWLHQQDITLKSSESQESKKGTLAQQLEEKQLMQGSLLSEYCNGIMGVPITFLDKYNPKQFEILGITDRQNTSGLCTKKYTAEDSPKYNDLNARSVLLCNGEYKQTYARILIKRKENKNEN